MSNITFLIANAYKNFENHTSDFNNRTNNANSNKKKQVTIDGIKDLLKRNKILVLLLTVFIISILTFGLSLVLRWNDIVIGGSIIIYGICMLAIIPIVDKSDIKNYYKYKDDYYNKIKKFKEEKLEKEFLITSKSKLEQLIKECDVTSNELKESSKIIKNSSELWKNIILPIVTFGIGTVIKLDSISKLITWKIVAQGIVLAILFLFMCIGAYMIIKPILDIIFNDYSNRVEKLKSVLNDIYLIYYI
ncbi:hypothetical protein [Clostridium aciditolerans]|uniref:Uncharacterized protein n=1 Tax=Clostridium aciditolerans TaxID=339861 RepID=A0A934M5B2_9CLOT|nr:hypothetical protein [Clostridium aciditolerans]MBI6874905.1 hypothetical protein [Clostridium aciditolerans]